MKTFITINFVLALILAQVRKHPNVIFMYTYGFWLKFMTIILIDGNCVDLTKANKAACQSYWCICRKRLTVLHVESEITVIHKIIHHFLVQDLSDVIFCGWSFFFFSENELEFNGFLWNMFSLWNNADPSNSYILIDVCLFVLFINCLNLVLLYSTLTTSQPQIHIYVFRFIYIHVPLYCFLFILI